MALIKCKECGREVSTEAAACPACGAPIKMIPAKKAEPEKVGFLNVTVTLIAAVAVFFLFWSSWESDKKDNGNGEPDKTREQKEMASMFGHSWDASSHSQPSSTPAPTATPDIISGVSWQEIDVNYHAGSKLTDLQKDEKWKEFKGKRIKWAGKVSAVSDGWSGLSLQVKMNKDTFTSDLIVKLRNSEKSKVMKFSVGDRVTFVATLNSWGTLLPVSLIDGEIIESK
jgi:hypothetical protein